MICPGPDQDSTPAKSMTNPTLHELHRLGQLIAAHALAAKKDGAVAPNGLIDPIVCNLETAATVLRGLGS